MRLTIMNKYGMTVACSALVSLAVLNGCSSGGTTVTQEAGNDGRAIDGFIVGGTYKCFTAAGVETNTGSTAAAGSYSCNTTAALVSVAGGVDVGFNALEDGTSGTFPGFSGVLKGLATEPYVTPISSLVIALATDASGNYQPTLFDGALATVKSALGLTEANPLAVNPVDEVSYAQTNMQIAAILDVLTSTADGYQAAMKGFAAELGNATGVVDLSDVATLTTIMTNIDAGIDDTAKSYTSDQLSTIVSTVADTNQNIADASDITALDNVIVESVEKARSDYALVIEKEDNAVSIKDTDGNVNSYSMTNYITPDKDNAGKHQIVLSNKMSSIDFLESAVSVENTFSDQVVNVGIKVESDSDDREIALIGRGLKMSATQGDSASIQVTIPDGMVWKASSVNAAGTKLYTELVKDEDKVFSSANDGLKIDFGAISKRLSKVSNPNFDASDFLDITKHTGDFKITVVIDGIEVGKYIASSTTLYSSWGYNVAVKKANNTEADSLYSTGWEGYFTVQ